MAARWLALALAAALSAACGRGDGPARPRIGVMPKLVGIDYFSACERGAREAGMELGVEVVYDGPLTNDVTRQAEMIDTWIAQRFDAIAVAPNDPHALAPTLRRALARGIAVLTWDADSEPDSRRYFVNQATSEDIGCALVDILARQIGGRGQVAIVTGSLTAANQNLWMESMHRRLAGQYPAMQVVAVKRSEEDQHLAFQVSRDLLKAYPDLAGIFAITSVALPGAAEALRQSGAGGRVALTGLATPNSMRQYVRDGTVQTVLLWNPVDLGYLTVQVAAHLAAEGSLPPELAAGRLGTVAVRDGQVLLGPPLQFDRANIDHFDF